MYDPAAVLHAIDQNKLPILVLSTIALLANFVFFGEPVRLGRRHRCQTMPLAGVYLFIAHDTSYVLLYDKWFHQYDHWFCQLYWLGLIVTLCLELVFFAQILRYGRQEMFPRLSQSAFAGLVLAGLPAAGVMWWCLKQNLNDDLFVLTFFLTVFPNPALCLPMLARRQSRRGTSPLMWQAFLVMTAAFFASTLYMGDYFRSLTWWLVGLVTLSWGALMLVMVQRAPDYRPEPAGGREPA